MIQKLIPDRSKWFKEPFSSELVISFSNEMGGELNVEDINRMIEKLEAVADFYGYSVSTCGDYDSAVKFFGRQAFSRIMDHIVGLPEMKSAKK